MNTEAILETAVESGSIELSGMPELQEIASYIQSISFDRKSFGGCDEKSVSGHISVIAKKYEAIISAMLIQNRQTAAQLEQDYAAREQYALWLVHWYEQENAALREENQQWQLNLQSFYALL